MRLTYKWRGKVDLEAVEMLVRTSMPRAGIAES
jgi:hypothetical protein